MTATYKFSDKKLSINFDACVSGAAVPGGGAAGPVMRPVRETCEGEESPGEGGVVRQGRGVILLATEDSCSIILGLHVIYVIIKSVGTAGKLILRHRFDGRVSDLADFAIILAGLKITLATGPLYYDFLAIKWHV